MLEPLDGHKSDDHHHVGHMNPPDAVSSDVSNQIIYVLSSF